MGVSGCVSVCVCIVKIHFCVCSKDTSVVSVLVILLNFCNHCKMSHRKHSSATISRTFSCFKNPHFNNIPNLIQLQSSHHFLYKYSCLGYNKSVFNWTFCQLLYSQKNPIVQKCAFLGSLKWLVFRKSVHDVLLHVPFPRFERLLKIQWR